MATPYYNVTGHPLLSEQAASLGSTELTAHTQVAIALLKLDEFPQIDQVTAAADYIQAANAVALQVSFQVESGIDAFFLANQTVGSRNMTFRGGSRRMPITHGIARKIANKLRPATSTVVR